VINKIIEECNGIAIDIEDSGLVCVTGINQEDVDKAVNWIKGIVREVEVGEVFQGKVVKIMDFGAFVDIGVHQDGLIHISQMTERFIKDPNEVVQLNQKVTVRVLEVDKVRKRIQLSMKNIE